MFALRRAIQPARSLVRSQAAALSIQRFQATAAAAPSAPAAPAAAAYDAISPRDRALAIIDSVEPSSVIDKAGKFSVGAALAIFLYSKEWYVVTAESFLILPMVIGWFTLKQAMYSEWFSYTEATQINRVTGYLQNVESAKKNLIEDAARSEREKELGNVILDVLALKNDNLNLVSELVAKKRENEILKEAKDELDFFARSLQQRRQQEQADVANKVNANVAAAILDPKLQAEILQQAIAQIEAIAEKASQKK